MATLKNLGDELKKIFSGVNNAMPYSWAQNPQVQQKIINPIATGIKNTAQSYVNAVPSALRLSPPGQAITYANNLRNNVSGIQNAKNQIGDVAKAAPLVFGAGGLANMGRMGLVNALKTVLPNAALGGVFSKATGGSFMQGVGQGIASSPQIAGVTSLTNPFIANTVGKYTRGITNPITKTLASRGATGLLNIPEGAVINSALGRPGYAPTDAVMDFATGALFGPGKRANALGMDSTRNTRSPWHSTDLDMVDEVFQTLYNTKKLTEEQINKADKDLTYLIRAYIPNPIVEGLASKFGKNKTGFMKAVVKELYKSYQTQNDSHNPFITGIVENGQFKGKYQRGDLTKLGNYLDDLLGTDSFIANDKWTSRLPARETAKRQLEQAAKQGDEEAKALLEQVDFLENQIAKAQFAKEGVKIPKDFGTTPPQQSKVAQSGVGNNQLRKARPGSYTNVTQIDNPLVAKVNNQKNQMQPLSTEQQGGLQPPQSKPFSSQNIQTGNLTQGLGESTQQPRVQQGQTGQGGSSLPPQKSDSSSSIIPPKTSGFIQAIKDKANALYTESIDRFNPLSQIAKTAKKDQAMRNALTGHYGAGSTANYHVDYELTPILKEQNIDELRRAAIALRDVELSSRGIRGSNTGDPIKALNDLEGELGKEKMKALGETLKKLYAYQDKIVKEYLVKTGVISEESYNAMRKNNQFYVPFKRVMDQVDDFLGFVPQTKQAGSVSGQNVVFKIKGSDKEIVDPIESIIESTYKSVGLGMRQKVARTIVGLKNDLPEGMITKIDGNVGNKPSVSLFENGKVVHYLVPPEVADAAKGLSEESLNTIVKILSAPTKLFRASATGINPEFMAPNVVRDLQSAFVNAGLNPLRWVQGFAHQLKKDGMYQEFLKAGGKTSRISIDRPMLKKTVDEISGKRGLSIANPKRLLNVLQTMGEYSEQPTRIAVFEKFLNKGLKEGLSREEAAIRAAYMAQEATVNFPRRGSKTQSINSIYAFLNARAQGVDRLARTIKNDPKGASLRIGMITAAPAVALYAWNRNFESYNDDRVVSEADRKSNFIIMLSDTPIKELGGAQYIKIAKGDIGRLANPMEEFLSYADNKGGDVKKALFDSLKSFMPIDNVGDVIPTAIRPLAELKANKNFFFNSEIIPGYKENLPPAYQDTSYTSPVYRMIGQKLGVSPAQIQHVVEGYGTGLAKIGEMVTRPLIPDQFRSTKNDQGAPINKTPVIRRFLGGERKTVEEQDLSNQKAQESLKFKINEVKGAINRGDIPLEAGRAQIEKLQSQYKAPQGSGAKGSIIYFMDDNGKYKEVDTSFQPTPPKLTGQTELDKKAISKFNGEITSKANDIYDLYKAGKITDQEAEKALNDLKSLKAKTGSGKLKKITFKKSAIKPIKVTLPKARKIATMKLRKPPKAKLAKFKAKTALKITKIKPIRAKKLKGLSAGVRLV